MNKQDQIKQLEDQMKSFQEQINKLKLEPQFEIGKWYKDRNDDIGGHVWYLEEIRNRQNPHKSYGLDGDMNWSKSDWRNLKGCDLATKEEILDALTKEAKRRGYINGININCGNIKGAEWIKGIYTLSGSDKYHLTNCYGENTLRFGGAPIYADGVWAEMIKPYHTKLTFGDKEVTIESKTSINCGGVKGTYKQLNDIYQSFNDQHLCFGSVKYEAFKTKSCIEVWTGLATSGWDRPEREIKIGCTWGKMGEIKAILDACDKL